MPTPSEPNKIILRNEIYPNGLTAMDIYDYYMKNKRKILNYCRNIPVLFFMKFDESQDFVVKRNHDGNRIFLNDLNYDNFISGYTVSISRETPDPTNYWIIDVDSKGRGTELQLKEAVRNILSAKNSVVNDVFKNYMITNSATGYHVYLFLNKKQTLIVARNNLINFLDINFRGKYSFSIKRNISGIVLDISPMYNRGSSTVPYSLTRYGTKCEVITDTYWKYNRTRSRIK